MSAPTVIGVVGAEWRAEYYLRIAQALPDRFRVANVLTRTEESADRVAAKYSVRSTTDRASFLAEKYDYVVVAVPRDAVPELIRDVVGAKIPVLAETPPAEDVEQLRDLYTLLGPDAPVQVAEQYRFQPHHEARLSLAHSGLIGAVNWTRASVAHGYHGTSLIRTALGVGFDPVHITASTLVDHVTHARGRDAWAEELHTYDSSWTTARLDLGGKVGIYEFNGEQYFSPIRRRRLEIYGERGEIFNDEVRYVVGPKHAVDGRLVRDQTGVDGDLEGAYLRQISFGESVHYSNVFAPARLSDDDLAVAACMQRMADFTKTHQGFYGLADASHDHYLSLLIDEAAATGQSRRTETQPWSHLESLASQSLEGLT